MRSWIGRREQQALGEPVGDPFSGPAFHGAADRRLMDPGSIIGAGAGLIGSVMGSDASDDAADAQSRSARDATELQKYMYDQTRTDQQPYRDVGYGALNRLATMLGLPSAALPGSNTAPVSRSYDQIRASLLPKYTGMQGSGGINGFRPRSEGSDGADDLRPTVNESGLNAEIQRIMANEAKAEADAKKRAAATGVNSKDPLFGILTRQFTGKDLLNEPGYQFGLSEGNRSIEANANAAGRNYSGATLKALQRYGQDYAGTKFGEAYNRDAAFKGTLFNQLSGVSGTGQAATNQVGQAGQVYANNAGNNMIGAGNVQAANSINQGNIFGNAINSAVSAFSRPTAPAANGFDQWLRTGTSGD